MPPDWGRHLMGKGLGAAAAPLKPFLPHSHTSVTRSRWTQLQQHPSMRSAACPCQTDPSTGPRGQGTRLGPHCVAFAHTRGRAGGAWGHARPHAPAQWTDPQAGGERNQNSASITTSSSEIYSTTNIEHSRAPGLGGMWGTHTRLV